MYGTPEVGECIIMKTPSASTQLTLVPSQGAWEREMAVSPLSAVGICVSVCLCYELFLASSSHGR